MTNNKYNVTTSSGHKSSSRLLTTGQATSRTYHKMITVTVDLSEDVSHVMDEMSIDLADDVSASALPSAQPLTSLQATLAQLRSRISERLDIPPERLQITFQVSPRVPWSSLPPGRRAPPRVRRGPAGGAGHPARQPGPARHPPQRGPRPPYLPRLPGQGRGG